MGAKGKGKAQVQEPVGDDGAASDLRGIEREGGDASVPPQRFDPDEDAGCCSSQRILPDDDEEEEEEEGPLSRLQRVDSDDDDAPLPSSSHSVASDHNSNAEQDEQDDWNDDTTACWCLICHTSPICDATILPACLHSQFCFPCILRWISIKRSCPLCLSAVGDYVIHSVRGDDDWLRYYLPPRSSGSARVSASSTVDRRTITASVQRARLSRHSPSSTRSTVAFRRLVYTHSLYAKHLGSNPHTGFRAAPSPSAIRNDALHRGPIVGRVATFLRRELHVWPHVDVEFTLRYVTALLQVHAVGDDEMVRLVAEVLGEEESVARHLCHELESWLRSGRTALEAWDKVVRYGAVGTRGAGVRDEIATGRVE